MQSTNGQASRKAILYARVSTEEQARSLSQSGDTRTLLRNATAAGSSSSSGGEPVVEFVNGPTASTSPTWRATAIRPRRSQR